MNFLMIPAVIKCFERHIPLFIYRTMQGNTHKYGHGEERNKTLIKRRNDITKGGQFCSL